MSKTAIGLQWSEPAPPTESVSFYDHVIAETPLGRIALEWKSWKDRPDVSGNMPWGELVIGGTLEEAKAATQNAWDAMLPRLLELASPRPKLRENENG